MVAQFCAIMVNKAMNYEQCFSTPHQMSMLNWIYHITQKKVLFDMGIYRSLPLYKPIATQTVICLDCMVCFNLRHRSVIFRTASYPPQCWVAQSCRFPEPLCSQNTHFMCGSSNCLLFPPLPGNTCIVVVIDFNGDKTLKRVIAVIRSNLRKFLLMAAGKGVPFLHISINIIHM